MMLWGESFDLYTQPIEAIAGYWDSGTNASSLTLVPGRFPGGQAAMAPTGAPFLLKNSGQNDALHHISVAFQQQSNITGSSNAIYFQLSDGTTNQVCVVFRTDGAILLTSATVGGTQLAIYTNAFTANAWYHFEIEVFISPTAGYMNVRRNGNVSNDFASATNLNTRPGTNSYANRLQFSSNANVSQIIDDLLWRSDPTAVPWLGDVRCYARRPAGDVSAVWQRAAGTLTQSTVAGTISNIASTAARLSPLTAYTGAISGVTFTVSSSGAGNSKCAIYASDAWGYPSTVLGTATAAVANPTSGAISFTFSPPVAVTGGQKVWLALATDSSWNLSVVSSGNTMFYTQGASFASTYASFPQPNPPYATVTTGLITATYTVTYAALTTNAGCVSDPQQDGPLTYCYSSNPSESDLYTIAGISSPLFTTVAVTTRGFFEKSDAGTRNAAMQIKSGGTTVQSTSTALQTAVWNWLYRIDLNDPATGSAWTTAAVAVAQIGPVVTA